MGSVLEYMCMELYFHHMSISLSHGQLRNAQLLIVDLPPVDQLEDCIAFPLAEQMIVAGDMIAFALYTLYNTLNIIFYIKC